MPEVLYTTMTIIQSFLPPAHTNTHARALQIHDLPRLVARLRLGQGRPDAAVFIHLADSVLQLQQLQKVLAALAPAAAAAAAAATMTAAPPGSKPRHQQQQLLLQNQNAALMTPTHMSYASDAVEQGAAPGLWDGVPIVQRLLSSIGPELLQCGCGAAACSTCTDMQTVLQAEDEQPHVHVLTRAHKHTSSTCLHPTQIRSASPSWLSLPQLYHQYSSCAAALATT
jgi:hypothetical protein